VIALVSGAALALAYPDYSLAFLGWFAIAGLTFACLRARTKVAAGCGLGFGMVLYIVSLPWIYSVMHDYGPLPGWQALALLILLSLWQSTYPVLFAIGVAWMSRRSRGLMLAATPFLWVALELVRTHVPDIGFPWDLLGYTASGSLALLQMVSVTGIYGLSLLVAAYNSTSLWAFLELRRSGGRGFLGTAGLVWTAATLGVLALVLTGSSLVPTAHGNHVAHLVQTDLPQSVSYPADWDAVHAVDVAELVQLSSEAGRARPDLVVWPEVPAPFSLQRGSFAARAVQIARDSMSYFLFGVIHWKSAGNHLDAFNSASLMDPAGQPIFTYDKIHLVPFSEYVPWRSWLWFASDITSLVSDFSTGSDYSVGQLPGGKFSVFICYEAIFPDQVRRYVENGAQLLVNISDDAWFGKSSALGQHLGMARVRAVENRRWLLRDTNTGETVSVDPYGRIVARLARYDRGVLEAPYDFRSDSTFYTRWGDWVAWLSVAATLAAFAITGLMRQEGKAQ
jgi:apolipoprotein N-acyltransferase